MDWSLSSTESLSETRLNYVIRQVICLFSVGIHLSLFWQDYPPWLLVIAVVFGIVYPIVISSIFRNQIKNSLFVDSVTYGFLIGIWGLNPTLSTMYFASSIIINLVAGGTRFCKIGALLFLLGAGSGFALFGLEYRPNLPLLAIELSSVALLFYAFTFGLKVFNINSRLRNTRAYLKEQHQELQNINALAVAVNAHLEIDDLMHQVMKLFEKMFPFEALYLLTFDNEQKHLEVAGIYGPAISDSEHQAFLKFEFDLEKDHNSLFVKALVKNKVVYIPEITIDIMSKASDIDKDLFAVKPSNSLAYFPIRVEDKIVGGACFINYDKTLSLRQEDLARIEKYMVQIGTAVKNVTLFRELVKARDEADEARKKAEASEEAKSRFLANMSHEIRTPMTAILGFSESLQDDQLSHEDQKKFTGHIMRSGQHLLSMINDILDISKIEASKIEVEQIPCNLIEILCDIDSYMVIKTAEKNIHYQLSPCFPFPNIIHSDSTRIKQILLNLCNNAVKFTQEGEICISLFAESDREISISVSDTGIGISEHEREKIFSAFDQADTSTTRLYGGTGLGLYISKNLAQLLGGKITLHSKKGLGSTFTLTLPVGCSDSPIIHNDEQYKNTVQQIKNEKTYSLAPKLTGKVLLAEDNPENQELMERFVTQTGLSVDIVENGALAVEAAANQPYDLVLMDMQMPIMGGKEAFKQLKEQGFNKPVIAFTANVMKHQISEYLKDGFAGILKKPIEKAKLHDTLSALLKSQETDTEENPKVDGLPASHVMIVDDNDVNQLILEQFVKKVSPNAIIEKTYNGQEALDEVAKNGYDLILMDMQMPVMDGLEATQHIRADGYDMPIYIVTGNIQREDVQRCIKAGATGHMAKPFNKQEVLLTIAEALQQGHSVALNAHN